MTEEDTEEGKGCYPSVTQLCVSLCLSSFREQKKSHSGKTVNQSLKYRDSVAVRVFSEPLAECGLFLPMTLFLLYLGWFLNYGGRKGSSSGVSIGTQGLTLLSELGIMVSVIQEPNLEPDARTVMGLLTPVNFPQPGGQRGEREERYLTLLHLFFYPFSVSSLVLAYFSLHLCDHF